MSAPPPDRAASTTALGVAMLRATHQLLDGEPKILDDTVTPRLLGVSAETLRARADAMQLPAEVAALRSHVLARSRFTEDRLADAAARGVRQYVVLGAGFDTFAYRQPAWAHALTIFEVDHPASQRAKQERLTAAGIEIPANVRFVPADLEAGTLADDLAAAGFDAAHPALLSALGLLVYLRPETVDGIFAFAASLAAGSEIVFTFSPPVTDRPDTLGALAAAAGEPWRTRQDPAELGPRLRELGFSDVRFVPEGEIARRYFHDRTDGLEAPRGSRIAHAVV